MSIIKILTLSFLLLGLTPAMGVAAEADEPVGTILEVEGNATITGADGAGKPAAVDTPVFLNDVIGTGAGSKAFLQLIDGSEFTLSENGVLTVDEYIFDPDIVTANKARYSVVRGAFLYTSGLITKKNNPDVKVDTAYGSIGIRGTQFWGGDIDDAYGILVNDGEVTVSNFAGQVQLAKGQGTSLRGRTERPGEIKEWPKAKIDRAVATIALRDPARLAQRIAARKELNQKIIERRKELLKKRGEIRQQRQIQRPILQQQRNNGDKAPIRKWKRPE